MNLQNQMIKGLMLFISVAVIFSACSSDNEDDLLDNGDCDTENVSYAEFVAPLMASHCNGCHGTSAPSAGIITATYEGLKVIADNGSLVGAINHASGFSPMPQGQPQLPDCTRLKVAAWVLDGALEN